jgi:hypothetical protein
VPDILLWPLNLWRDLPGRAGRLLGALAAGPSARRGRQPAAWLLPLAWYFFDLVGGPEIVQFFWRLATETRPLTREEIAAASRVLGPTAIRYGDVKIARRGFLQPIFRRNNNRAFCTWHTINLPDKREHNLPLLVHELTHTYQYERAGSVYITQGLLVQRRHGRAAYHYGGAAGLEMDQAAGKRYCDYNREQQGQIAQDYCELALAGQETGAYDEFINQLRAGAL